MPCNDAVILQNEPVATGVWRMQVPMDAPGKPGQFYMLRALHSTVLLPRPISLCDIRDGKLVFLYQVVGPGTEGFARLRPGESIQLTGPLGNGFPLEEIGEMTGPVALVGGGIGAAPLVYAARILRQNGVACDSYCGFRDQPFLTAEFGALCRAASVCTETGCAGRRGLVTDGFSPRGYRAVLCCGPTPMMRAVTVLCRAAGVPVYVSLETRMACGIGACLVCTCADKDGKNRRTCTEGPVFRGEEIDFDALR